MSPAPSADQLVTSSELVRHFGLWQERATRGPLYILHRGRPRFVMTSVETMDALCAPHAEGATSDAQLSPAQIDATAILDGVSDLVLVVDARGAILASSRAARAHFGSLAAPGTLVDGIVPVAMRLFLTDAIRRVMASGAGDRLDVPSAAREGRTLALAIEAAGAGVVLFAQDHTTERDYLRLCAAERAREEALLAAGGTASATINPRGYIDAPDASLAALTGLSREALATVRFTALVELADRVALGAAIEAVIAGGMARAVEACLLVNRADPLPVRIGLAPLRSGTATDGVAALIVAHAVR